LIDKLFFAMLGLAGQLCLVVVLLVLADLSRRFGLVAKRRPLYWAFYLSAALLLANAVLRGILWLQTHTATDQPQFGALIFFADTMFFAAVFISAFTAWRYWAWLLYEQDN
jgi:hypothetical protein